MSQFLQNTAVQVRNSAISAVYRFVAKPYFFQKDPEDVHDSVVRIGTFMGKFYLGRKLASFLFYYSNPVLEQNILGIHFPNPVGLSAGFDKNARLTEILPSVGLGFAELGSFTAEPCPGNSKPRLWRLISHKALVVYYGLYNDGAEIIANRIRGKKLRIPFGTSIAKTNVQRTCDVDEGVSDYATSFRIFANLGDYFTVNISCPNTFGGEPFTKLESFEKLFTVLDTISTKKPVFVKISPDLPDQQLYALLEIAKKHRIHGFICTNLTKDRENPKLLKKLGDTVLPPNGGISGKLLEKRSNEMLRKVYKKVGKSHVIIGVGGIFTAEDAYYKIRAGASLVQFFTGMIYQGPQVVSEINRKLSVLLKKDNFKNISEAVGADYRN